ncbi:MAG: Xaa-Pro peptidase family protein [Selenomonadaceae bacterium]
MYTRIARLQGFLKEKMLDAVVINKQENLQYFSGFTGDDTILVVSAEEAKLITDFRYVEQAGQQAKQFTIVEQIHGLLKKTAEVLQKAGAKRIGFEGNALTYDDFTVLQGFLPDASLDFSVKLDVLRMVKDADEISCIRKAVSISDAAFEHILTFLHPGIREIDVAAELEDYMRRLGSERPAFTTIVASGIRGSLPHGVATEKLIVNGEFVTMDYGAVYKGYHSDITRTVCVGHANEKQREIYALVLRAQLLGVENIQAGIAGKAVDAKVRDLFALAGYDKYFGHGLGHSLGLEIHEEPRLSPSSTCEELIPGMLITIEPGLYLPGWGGLRIEDTVLVTAEGGEPLTQSSKKLIELYK